MGHGSLGRVLLLQVSSHLVPLLLQESSHLVPLLLQESSLHFLSFFVKTFLVLLIMIVYNFLSNSSNCVICLCQDKEKVFHSAYNILKVCWMIVLHVLTACGCRMEESCTSVTCILTNLSHGQHT